MQGVTTRQGKSCGLMPKAVFLGWQWKGRLQVTPAPPSWELSILLPN